ncbi:MAG: hypothetical protein LBI61_03455 [Puniceicoccales bacterium]|nr:hypothetical protein [Puniceicoccales bacterium]
MATGNDRACVIRKGRAEQAHQVYWAKADLEEEIVRARGAAEAVKIENGSLAPPYIQYLWVRQQENPNDKTVIYIPTETNLPLLKARPRKN